MTPTISKTKREFIELLCYRHISFSFCYSLKLSKYNPLVVFSSFTETILQTIELKLRRTWPFKKEPTKEEVDFCNFMAKTIADNMIKDAGFVN